MRVRLGALAQEYGYANGSGITLLVRRLAALGVKNRKIKTKLDKPTADGR